jgi:hypothetical protein
MLCVSLCAVPWHSRGQHNGLMGAEPDWCQPVSAGRRGVGKTGENLLAWCAAHGWNHSLAPRAPLRYTQKRFTRGARRYGSWLFALSLRLNRVASKLYDETRRCFTAPRFPLVFRQTFRSCGTTIFCRLDFSLLNHSRHGRARPAIQHQCLQPAKPHLEVGPSATPEDDARKGDGATWSQPLPTLTSRNANLCHNSPLASHLGAQTRIKTVDHF